MLLLLLLLLPAGGGVIGTGEGTCTPPVDRGRFKGLFERSGIPSERRFTLMLLLPLLLPPLLLLPAPPRPGRGVYGLAPLPPPRDSGDDASQ